MEPGTPGSLERQLARLEEVLWVTEAQAGDLEAFIRLLKRYEKPLLYYLRRLVLGPEDALDLHQEVWVDAWRGLKSLHAPEAFRVWVYRIAHHKAARFLRQEIRQEQIAATLLDSQPHNSSGPELDIEAERLHRALEFLPPEQREILVIHYLRDLSLQEVAAVLEIPLGTVKSRLHHARQALRQTIERKRL